MRDTHSVPEKQPALREALRRFSSGEDMEPMVVSDTILRGWRISHELGIDPWNPRNPPVIPKNELETLRNRHKSLLSAAAPMLRMLEVSIRDTGYIATLAVSPGYLLDVVGDASLMEQAVEAFNIPGALRSIESVGASALTLCMLDKRPVQVSGFEHYNCRFHDWRCAAAPIFDAQGEPVASLTISGHISRDEGHTAALAKSCAEVITIRLREQHLLLSQQRLNILLQSVYSALPEAILAIDERGLISHANHNALTLFGETSLEGQPLSGFIHPESSRYLTQVFEKQKAESREITFLAGGDPIKRMCRFTPIRLEGGEAGGLIVTITAFSQLIDIATRVGGNYAKYAFKDIRGQNPALLEQIDLARRAAETSSRVLLTGESGTGKELFAQAIHNGSRVRGGPFVAISCASIPRDLIESELFGYVGGAFTGAREKGMIGKFELASGGTLFLDEINSLPMDMQAKLLRVLQQKEVMRIGDSRPTPVDTRIIAATNVPLPELVDNGSFRKDLYYRLNVVEIVIPPLRKRLDDIEMLANLILTRLNAERVGPAPRIHPETLRVLQGYAWPGNVRELDNVCERGLLLSCGGDIELDHLPVAVRDGAQGIHPFSDRAPASKALLGEPGMEEPLAETPAHTGTEGLDRLYHGEIIRLLRQYHGNVSKTAARLGIARTTLYRKLRRFAIDPERFAESAR